MSDVQGLFDADFHLLKGLEDTTLEFPAFAGVASSELEDEEGDKILKSILDISYLQDRGYVNWNHSSAAEDQVGFVRKADIIEVDKVPYYENLLGTTLNPSASIYVEAEVYKETEIGKRVMDILRSIPRGRKSSMGISVEGALQRRDGVLVKAKVRGIALTPSPVQKDTLCTLLKSLPCFSVSKGFEGVGNTVQQSSFLDEPDELEALLESSVKRYPGITRTDVLRVLKKFRQPR